MTDLQRRIDVDIKDALLSGDKESANSLKLIKSTLQNEAINARKRDTGLSQVEEIACLQRELKKRQEAAEMYRSHGADERAEKELLDQKIIERYLPEPLSSQELENIVDEVVNINNYDTNSMGKIISEVRSRVNGRATGAMIASLVKEKLSQ